MAVHVTDSSKLNRASPRQHRQRSMRLVDRPSRMRASRYCSTLCAVSMKKHVSTASHCPRCSWLPHTATKSPDIMPRLPWVRALFSDGSASEPLLRFVSAFPAAFDAALSAPLLAVL